MKAEHMATELVHSSFKKKRSNTEIPFQMCCWTKDCQRVMGNPQLLVNFRMAEKHVWKSVLSC